MKHFKQYLAIFCSSYILVDYPQALYPFTVFFLNLHNFLSKFFLGIGSNYQFGIIIAKFIAIIIVPILIAALPALIFYLAKKRFFPYFFHVIWVIWLIQATTLIITYHSSSPPSHLHW